MGYTTDFRGSFEITPKLSNEDRIFLTKLAQTRRMQRKLDSKYGVEGEFFVDGAGDFGQDEDKSITDYNRPPRTQPSLWLQWIPNEDGSELEWDGNEKFYSYIEWLQYLITNIFKPKGYKLNGTVEWRGEDWDDTGSIVVKDNKIKAS